jgi:hypothetical protein
VFSAQSAPIAAQDTMDTSTEQRCFLCGPCLDVIKTISECRTVELSELERVGW